MRNNLIIVLVLFFNGISLAQNDFDSFIKKFSNDSAFQLNHVKFPLNKVIIDAETYEYDTLSVCKKDYRTVSFYNSLIKCSEAYPVVYDNFELNESNSTERVFRWKGFTGMDNRYFFKKISGTWVLVKVEILGT